MVEIIKEDVKMPSLYAQRRYKLDYEAYKWFVKDTHLNRKSFIGDFETASIACLNLNKKYYRDKES